MSALRALTLWQSRTTGHTLPASFRCRLGLGLLYNPYHTETRHTRENKLQSRSAHRPVIASPSNLTNQWCRKYSSHVKQDHGSKMDGRVFFFDVDNCLYSKKTGIPQLMNERIEKYFRDSGIPSDEVKTLAHRYYVDYGLAIRGLVERHPEIDIRDYDNKVDGALPLETLLNENQALRSMIHSMDVGKKWLFTNAGETHAKRVVKILGLEGLFDGITFCNYLERQFVCKPDKKAFERAMVQAGVLSPDLCYFVDDSAANIEMATKIGWTTVHVNEEPSGSALLGNFQIRSIMELPTVMPQFWDHRRGSL